MKNRNTAPKVSVIIPVYNTEKYLRQCLDSVVNQTLKEIEIICVDDGSTDGSLDILREYEKADDRVKVISTENHGVSHARNTGLAAAGGEYVCFVDSDDYIGEKCFRTLIALARKNDADLVVFGGKSFPTVQWVDEKLDTRSIVYKGNFIDPLLKENGSIPFICCKLYRGALLKKYHCTFNEKLKLGEDQAFQFDVFPKAKTIVFTKSKFYYYRQGRQGAAMVQFAKINGEKMHEHLKIVEYVYEKWAQEGYITQYGAELAEWMLGFLVPDLLAAGYDLRVWGCKRLYQTLSLFVCPDSMSEENRNRYEVVKQIAQEQHTVQISVIVPVYNAGAYLPECLDTLSRQTFRDFEMIFVDDGSTDDSLDILREYAAADTRATVLTQEHRFAGAARNLGMSRAAGKYLLFLDSDDRFDLNMLERAYQRIEEKGADICVFPVRAYDQQTGKYAPMPWTCDASRCPDKDIPFSRHDNARFIYAFTTPAPWNKLFRKEFVLQHDLQFQVVRSANDMAFVMTALALAEKIIVLDEVLLTYRINNSQSLQGSQDKKPLAFYDALMELKTRLIKFGVYAELEQPFEVFAQACCLYNLGTLHTKRSFDETFLFLKNTGFSALEVLDKPRTYYYADTANNYDRMQDIMVLSPREYREKYQIFLEEEQALYELQEVRASWSYRIGRGITFVPRKIRGGVRCWRENGLRYTCVRFKEKLRNKFLNIVHK